MSENKTLNLISLGCAKNLVDSEILLGGLNKTNVTLTDNPEEADTIVVNTCGFLDIAREESVDTILQAAELKKTGNLKELVVMGCLSERYPEELKKEMSKLNRQALHAYSLSFIHPTDRKVITKTAPIPRDMEKLIINLREHASNA